LNAASGIEIEGIIDEIKFKEMKIVAIYV